MSNPQTHSGESLKKETMLEDFRANVISPPMGITMNMSRVYKRRWRLTRTHCCSWRFLGEQTSGKQNSCFVSTLRKPRNIFCGTKCFWKKKKQKHFLFLGCKSVCFRNKCCAREQTGKHLFPQHCVLVCHYLILWNVTYKYVRVEKARSDCPGQVLFALGQVKIEVSFSSVGKWNYFQSGKKYRVGATASENWN